MSKPRVALWEAIHRYVRECGGDPARHIYGHVSRQDAVAAVELEVDAECRHFAAAEIGDLLERLRRH